MMRVKGYLLIIAASFGFGVMPALALNAYAGGINVMTMLCLKYLLVSVLMVPMTILRYKAHRLPGAILGKIFLLSATLYTAQAVLYAFAVTLIPVALAALILFTYPILVGVLGALAFKERLTAAGKLWLGAAFLGLLLMFARPVGDISPLGVLAALGASVSYAVYVILIGRVTGGIAPPVTNTVLNAGAAVSVTAISLLTGQLTLAFTPVTWLYVLYNAVFVGIAAYWMWLAGLKILGSVKASVLSLSEPVFASLASLLLHGQALRAPELLGGAVLLAAITMFVYGQNKAEREQAAAT